MSGVSAYARWPNTSRPTRSPGLSARSRRISCFTRSRESRDRCGALRTIARHVSSARGGALRLLGDHPLAEIRALTAERQAGKPRGEAHHMGFTDDRRFLWAERVYDATGVAKPGTLRRANS